MNRRSSLTCAFLLVAGTVFPGVAQAEQTAGAAADECTGVTWTVRNKLWDRDLTVVGSDSHTNAYRGDTSCDTSLPVLCLRKSDLPVPPGITPTYHEGWSGGEVRLTPPVPGYALYSRAVADGFCASRFGEGWRMGEHHDGDGGWSWWAVGDLTRVWLHINDQFSNPWNTRTGRAMTWTKRAQEWGRDLVDWTSDKKTDAYRGDTPVTAKLPVLCLLQDGREPPTGINPGDFYNGWARGEARITQPVVGTSLTSLAVADALCAGQFGTGWRTAEFHDARGGWGWWASGNVGRFWTAIDDQPANPWDHLGT
ncbi:hypothetical protein AB0I60_20570 [Actinosynnema sp. NPDC050436]|uniref:hypothetical protein n=1 Tax=Actinosynnema sp. NPDC050436 TaxID=3155659 RepID=UPI0033FA4E6A